MSPKSIKLETLNKRYNSQEQMAPFREEPASENLEEPVIVNSMMRNFCSALKRNLVEANPEIAAAVATKANWTVNSKENR